MIIVFQYINETLQTVKMSHFSRPLLQNAHIFIRSENNVKNGTTNGWSLKIITNFMTTLWGWNIL